MSLEPSALRHDFDGYGYQFLDNGSGSNWKTMGGKDAEFLYTKEDIITFLQNMRVQYMQDSRLIEDENNPEHKYYVNVAYGLKQIIDDLWYSKRC